MNLGPFTHTTRPASARRSGALAGTRRPAAPARSVPLPAAPPTRRPRPLRSKPATATAAPSAGDTSAAGTGGSVPDAAPAVAPARPAVGSTQWPQLTWYTAEEHGQKQNDPARIWRRTPGWDAEQLVRSGRPQNGKSPQWPARRLAGRPTGGLGGRVRPPAGDQRIRRHEAARHPDPGSADLRAELARLRAGAVRPGAGDGADAHRGQRRRDRAEGARHPLPEVPDGVRRDWIAQVGAQTVAIGDERGVRRAISPRLPAGLVIGGVAAISGDGRTLVISAHTTSPGGCGCSELFTQLPARRGQRGPPRAGAVRTRPGSRRPGTAKPSTGSSWPTAVWWCRSTRRTPADGAAGVPAGPVRRQRPGAGHRVGARRPAVGWSAGLSSRCSVTGYEGPASRRRWPVPPGVRA